MATTVGGKQCNYCRRSAGQEHNSACPVAVGTTRAMQAWEYGWREGQAGKEYTWRQEGNFDPSRILGYRIAKRDRDLRIYG
ncbi:MAG: hypothetical protein HY420_01450 [Candidatus Kerfeldbacteria bacterium]|nr:hypothetical protein [Candidatus Kerfeldbacteria bacterium]